MRAEWTGFYGPSYRLMLESVDQGYLSDEIWEKVVEIHRNNPKNEGHWEFLALGYLILFDQSEVLSEIEKLRLSSLLIRFNPNHPATNWRLISQIVKRRIAGGRISKVDIDRVRLIQDKEGFLQDIPADRSSQYHAFLLFLIMRFSCPKDMLMRLIVHRAFGWLVSCHQLYGDPSPLGRGRFQLFGYAAMAAAAGLSDRWEVQLSDDWSADVWSRLSYDRMLGSLSPKWDGPHRSYLLHGYNTIDDYPAFVSMMTYNLIPKHYKLNPRNSQMLWWHPLDNFGSGLLADYSGIRIGIIASKGIDPPLSRRQQLKHLFREKQPEFLPLLVNSAQVLPLNNMKFCALNGHIKFFWSLEDSNSSESRYTIWTISPHSSLRVTGSVEMATLEWKQNDTITWNGLDLRIVRFGSVEAYWIWQ